MIIDDIGNLLLKGNIEKSENIINISNLKLGNYTNKYL